MLEGFGFFIFHIDKYNRELTRGYTSVETVPFNWNPKSTTVVEIIEKYSDSWDCKLLPRLRWESKIGVDTNFSRLFGAFSKPQRNFYGLTHL